MSGDDCEIEYLDEDEEIVQQYVQSVPIVETVSLAQRVPAKKPTSRKSAASTESEGSDLEGDSSASNDLLVERKSIDHKRKRVGDTDSDYDPFDDMHPPKKKKKPTPKRTSKSLTIVRPTPNTSKVVHEPATAIQDEQFQQTVKEPTKQKKTLSEELQERKRLDIRIPDFEDPLCLPARALRKEDYDYKLLKRWNNLCLERIKVADRTFKPNQGTAVSSCRTIVFRNTSNVTEGKVETSIWGKLYVTNEDKQRKSEMFQGTLPRYKDHHIKRPFKLLKAPIKKFHHVNEVILTKEEYKDEQMLVVYRPEDAVSAIYKTALDPQKTGGLEEGEGGCALREAACCRVCAACYHASWRGTKLHPGSEMKISCSLCHCTFVSVYNLLSHIKLHHESEHVRHCRTNISKLLAKLIDYHYKCRLCQQQFLAIKDLRKHLATQHKGSTLFKCEVGDHMTY